MALRNQLTSGKTSNHFVGYFEGVEMMEWPFPWECGKLQWRTQLKESGLIQVRNSLEDFIARIRQLQMEKLQAGSDQQLNSFLQGAEKDLKLVDRWMGFCK